MNGLKRIYSWSDEKEINNSHTHFFCGLFSDYRVGSADGWSALYNFNATRNGTEWAPRFAVYGDLGVDNAQSLSKLQKEVQSGQYDAILHVGKYL